MDDTLKTAFVLAYAYVLGSINASYIVGRLLKGIDLRRVGSGTVGASNVWYHVGKFWFFPIGVFDVFVKGMTSVVIARALDLDVSVQAGAALLAVVGHNWSIFLGLQGGRGVAPTVGTLLALGRLELAAFVVIGTAGWQLTGSAAVWVLVAFASLPVLALWWDRPTPIVLYMLGLALATVVKRLASNSLGRVEGVSFGRLMLNRLLFDRDIADHDEWVRRSLA